MGRQDPLPLALHRQDQELQANALGGPDIRERAGCGAPGSFHLPLPGTPPFPQQHIPISILVVNVESLRGAEELWGVRGRGHQGTYGTDQLPCPYPHLAHSHHPPSRTQPTFWGTEKHLPHGPFQVLSLRLEGTEHSKPLQQWPAFPKAPAQLVYRAKGGGKGYRPDVPSLGQAHGVHGLHSCLNGRESYCPIRPRGTGVQRRVGV